MISILAFVLVAFVTVSIKGLTNNVDYDAIESLYMSTNGPDWEYRVGSIPWNFTGGYSEQNPCGDSWDGITCSDTPTACLAQSIICTITSLNLTNHALSGNLPFGLGALTNISTLALGTNSIIGTLPLNTVAMST